jgi:hypothetical protein
MVVPFIKQYNAKPHSFRISCDGFDYGFAGHAQDKASAGQAPKKSNR